MESIWVWPLSLAMIALAIAGILRQLHHRVVHRYRVALDAYADREIRNHRRTRRLHLRSVRITKENTPNGDAFFSPINRYRPVGMYEPNRPIRESVSS